LLQFRSETRWLRHARANLGHLFRYLPVKGQFVLPAGGQEFSPLVARWFSPTAAR
jgi:hypothetical protein